MRRTRRSRCFVAAAALGVAGACAPPPSVQAVDRWLTAYARGDVEAMVRNTAPADRELVRAAMAVSDSTSALPLALPPRPLSHELVEIEKKEPRRHVVLCRVTLKNPLPFMSEKVGQQLEIPKTRTRRRRFLSVQGPDGAWGVQLDLARVIERTEFVRRFERALAAKDYAGAEAMLADVPPPPDEANAQATKDRLRASLAKALARATRSSSAARVETATTSAPPH